MLPYWTRVEIALERHAHDVKVAQAAARVAAKAAMVIPADIAAFADDARVEAVTFDDGCFYLELAEGFEYGGASMVMCEVCEDAARYLAADLAEVEAV